MWETTLDELQELHLLALSREEIPESISLEYKRELSISSQGAKAEAAKDVSAMANTVGGRILYGIDERTLPDNSTVASAVCPLTDGDLAKRLEDVLLATIQPRPRFRTRMVPVGGGYVLVVEVYPAYAADLHMVTGFGESRFYRRGEQRTVLMTEPEIREAYARVAASSLALDTQMEKAISSELSIVPSATESVMVVPWYGHRDLINPMRFGANLGRVLHNGPLNDNDWRNLIKDLRIVSDGFQASDDLPLQCHSFVSVRRSGLVHLSQVDDSPNTPMWVSVPRSLETMIAGLAIAGHILERASYWGPVRVLHRWTLPRPFCIDPPDSVFVRNTKPIAAGEYVHLVPQVNLKEPGMVKLILKSLLDQVFQTAGKVGCPWFELDGRLRADSLIPQHLSKYLR